MVRFIKIDYVSPDGAAWLKYIEAAGLSTDEKPTDKIVTGSKFLEVDTGKEYAYDEIGGEWYEMASGSSGGGSSGGGTGIFWVNAVVQEDDSLTLDKTYSEIKSAIANGQVPILTKRYFDDPNDQFTLLYLVSSEENILFKNLPTITSSNVLGTGIIIYSDNSVIVRNYSMPEST